MNPIHEGDLESDASKASQDSQTFEPMSSSDNGASEIGSKETRMVNYSKVLVVSVIVVVAIAIGVTTHKFVSGQEAKNHKKQVRKKEKEDVRKE